MADKNQTSTCNDEPLVPVEEIYRQQFAHFTKMNDLFYKLPIGFATIIGGLWFFGAEVVSTNKMVAEIVFAFAAICCLAFLFIMERFGAAFNAYIDNLNHLEGRYHITIKHARWRSSKRVMMYLLLAALILSVIAFLNLVSVPDG